ncbi:MAG: hypothetical protein EXR50_05320 [Dehalococcoidia bacterium]|nr:hypothetical protein [Dehalococcoidia bacterium]
MTRKRKFQTKMFAMVSLALALLVMMGCSKTEPKPGPTVTGVTGTAQKSHKDASYEIEGRVVALTNGVSEVEAALGSASKITTRYFGNEATGDVNGDGTPDLAFLLTQSSGGSGTFYYAVAAVGSNGGYRGTNAVLLGDRIAPQTTEFRGGTFIVNYAERKPGEPMTASPSVGVSKYLKIVNEKLVVVNP